ncbi:MAG: aminotransferase class I/II-fold pyridoxal phosphate-dependent enzyme [Gemmatimonadota bacterium]|nr:aminotransferase class I/II-fold pyridoxal phosphate-dependent enzyme [Gemmatimonadota bacterium]
MSRGAGPDPDPGGAPEPDLAELELDRETMRALGYRVVDLLVEHWSTLRDQPAGRTASRERLEALLDEPPAEDPGDPEAILQRLERDVLGWMGRVHHPRFFAFIPSPSNFVSVLGDAIAAGHNVFAGTWFESAGPAMLELVVLDWLRSWCGMPESTGGVLTSGGSMANLTALAVARRVRLDDDAADAVVYASDQTHSAVDRGLAVLGFDARALRRLRSDEAFRLSPGALAGAIAEDRAAGRRPFCVVANAGTTNTGAVDPLEPLAEVCEREGLWLHVDAAYGGGAVLCEEGRRALAGLERADSVALDPHKWLFQPYEIGCVLVREEGALLETFHVLPDYLRDVEAKRGEVNFGDRGVQLTRSFRALKLWLSIQVFGLRAFRGAVERGLENARFVESILEESDGWEVTSPASLGIVTFRWSPPGVGDETAERITAGLVEASQEDGFTLVSSTRLDGRTVVRMCPINPRTTKDDLRASVERLEELAGRLATGGGRDPAT